jgi:starch synthase
MKTLFLTNEYPPYIYGGAGVHVEYLTRELARLMPVEVRCFGDQRYQSENLQVTGFGFEEKVLRNADRQLRSPLQALSRCVGFCGEPIAADMVHCHTWYTHFGGILAKKTYGIPLIITTHSLEPLRPWKREQLGLGYDLSCWIERTALEMADGIIAVSESMKRDILELFAVNSHRVRVIYNGIDVEEYRPVAPKGALQRFGIDPRLPYVLFVGRITRQKGIIHLINAINYLEPDTQVVLCAGAPDTEAIAREMEHGVRAIQETHNRVLWITEILDKETLVELYSNAAVFCCPSIYEPFGIIILEAMACGTPVVASAVGGIREVVVDGVTGILVSLDQHTESPFEPKDPDTFARDLAAPINRLIRDEGLRRQMSEAGRSRVVELFSWAAIAKQVYAFYRDLV